MIKLEKACLDWGRKCFNETFKHEVEQLDALQLPLQAGLSQSSVVSDEPFRVMVISSAESQHHIEVRAGIFYSGIIAGCSCSDDPTLVEPQTEYCELVFTIDRESGEMRVTLASEPQGTLD